MTGVPQLREVKESLAWADRFPNARMGVETRPALDAARCLVEVAETSEEVEWCEVHGDCVFDHGECLVGRFSVAALSVAPCHVVSRRLVDPQLLGDTE